MQSILSGAAPAARTPSEPLRTGAPLLSDVPELTKDWEGYVYWKGNHVEHYSFDRRVDGPSQEAAAARELVTRCLQLERLGLPVNSRTALQPDCFNAPLDSPWKPALPQYYAFFREPRTGAVVGIFYRTDSGKKPKTAFIIENVKGVVVVSDVEGAYEAFRAFADAGLESLGISQSYGQTETMLTALNVSPERLALEIAGEDVA